MPKSNFNTINSLALFGGKKSITFNKPHWLWPVNSKNKIKVISNYFRNEHKYRSGYPEEVKNFERNFCKYLGTKYGLTTNSGTSALFAAFFAIDLRDGDEVIVPSLTYHASASPLVQFNCTPILADIELDTGNIDSKEIENLITKKTKAIVITHLCGHPCEMNEILKLKKKYNLKLIEDCSHAHGSLYNKKKVGTFGDISCFSLGNQKMLPSGEAGILVTNNKKLYERSMLISDFNERLSNEISDINLKKFSTTGLGFKHRINPISAVIANFELKNIDKTIRKRNKILNEFSEKLINIPGISPPITKKNMFRGAFFGYRPFINFKEINNIKLDKIIQILQAEGMEVRRSSHPPLHQLSLFKEAKSINRIKKNKNFTKSMNKKQNFKNAEKYYNSTISIPTFTFEKKELILEYINCFKKVFRILSENKLN